MKVENVNKSEKNNDNFNRTALDDGQAKGQQSNNRGNTLPNNVEDIVDITGNSDLLKILEADVNKLSDGSSKKDVLFYNNKTNQYSDVESAAEDKDAVQDKVQNKVQDTDTGNSDESNNKTEPQRYTNVKERMLFGKNEYNKTASNSTNLTSLGLRREYGTPNRLNSFVNSEFNASKNPFYSGQINNAAVFRGGNVPIADGVSTLEGNVAETQNNGNAGIFENSNQVVEVGETSTADGVNQIIKEDAAIKTESVNIQVSTPNEKAETSNIVINDNRTANTENLNNLNNFNNLGIDGFNSDDKTDLRTVENLTVAEVSDKSFNPDSDASDSPKNSKLDLNVKVQGEEVKTVSEQKVNVYETRENINSPAGNKGLRTFDSVKGSENDEKSITFNTERTGYTKSVRNSANNKSEYLRNEDNSEIGNSHSFVNRQSHYSGGLRNGRVQQLRNYGYEPDSSFSRTSFTARDKQSLNISEKRLEIEKRNINSNEYVAAQMAYQAIAQRNINDIYRGFSDLEKLIAVLFRLRKLTVKKAGKSLKEIYGSQDEEDEAKLLLGEAKNLIEHEGYKRGRVIHLLNRFLDDQEKIKYCVGLSPFPIATRDFNDFFDNIKDETEDIKKSEEKARRDEIMKSVIRVFALALLVIVFYIIFMR